MDLRPFLDPFNLIGYKKSLKKFIVCKLLSKYINSEQQQKRLSFHIIAVVSDILPTIDNANVEKITV